MQLIAPGRLRAYVLGCIAVVLLTTLAAAPKEASAATYHYCSSCRIYNESYVNSPYALQVSLNYVHYLGTGNRLMGAGVVNYSTSWAWNEVQVIYAGQNNYIARAGYSGSNSYATSNAHENY